MTFCDRVPASANVKVCVHDQNMFLSFCVCVCVCRKSTERENRRDFNMRRVLLIDMTSVSVGVFVLKCVAVNLSGSMTM